MGFFVKKTNATTTFDKKRPFFAPWLRSRVKFFIPFFHFSPDFFNFRTVFGPFSWFFKKWKNGFTNGNTQKFEFLEIMVIVRPRTITKSLKISFSQKISWVKIKFFVMVIDFFIKKSFYHFMVVNPKNPNFKWW